MRLTRGPGRGEVPRRAVLLPYVPVSEVSTLQSTQQAREVYEKYKTTQKLFS